MDFVDALINSNNRHAPVLKEIKSLHQKKLWHQLTDKVEELLRDSDFVSQQDTLLHFYQDFIKEFELKLNLLRLAVVIVEITKHLKDANVVLELLNTVSEKVHKKDTQAYIVLRTEVALWKIKQEQLKEAKEILENVKQLIDDQGQMVDNQVHSAYYRVYATYLKVTDQAGEFYKAALLYLAYTPIEHIPHAQQQAIAFDLGIAALLGENVYNFGELLMHQAINSLEGTPNEWLSKILFAFNRGDIQSYGKLVETYKANLTSQPGLTAKAGFLKQKIQLMALMELAFTTSGVSRTLTFQQISEHTSQPVADVEALLLKALALDLIKGVIDQVSQTIYVSWVQPRVLDKTQIKSLSDSVNLWLGRVNTTLSLLEKETAELI